MQMTIVTFRNECLGISKQEAKNFITLTYLNVGCLWKNASSTQKAALPVKIRNKVLLDSLD